MFFHKVFSKTSGWALATTLQEKVKTSSVILLIFPHNDFFAEIGNFCFLNTASAYDNKPLLGNQQQCCLKVNPASLKKRCGKALRSGNLQNHHELIAYNFICLILSAILWLTSAATAKFMLGDQTGGSPPHVLPQNRNSKQLQ